MAKPIGVAGLGMKSRLARLGLIAAFAATSAMARPITFVRPVAGHPAPLPEGRFDLASRPALQVAVKPRQVSPVSEPGLAARGSQFGDALIQGPSFSYRTDPHGPVFEMGALGGGEAVIDAPFLAHLGMAWRF